MNDDSRNDENVKHSEEEGFPEGGVAISVPVLMHRYLTCLQDMTALLAKFADFAETAYGSEEADADRRAHVQVVIDLMVSKWNLKHPRDQQEQSDER